MARGKEFNHKKKGHPGPLPKSSEKANTHLEDPPGDEEFLVVREAFKNRIETQDNE